MRFIPILALALLLPLAPVHAQIWARQPGAQAPAPAQTNPPETEPEPADDQSVPSPDAQTEPYQATATDAAKPRMAPPPGMSSSLGGSGATGPDSVGILPARDTDFERTTWRYTQMGTVLGLMERLPERMDSAAQNELARNLLVSIADAPSGDSSGSRLLEVRVRKLLAIGNAADAAALARAAPGTLDNAALAHSEIQAELLAGQIESACIDLRAFANLLTDPASQAAVALCRQTAGEPADPNQPALETDTLGAAARITGAPLSIDASSPPARLAAVALDERADPAERLAAAFAAGRASALYGEVIARIFGASPVGSLPAEGGAPTDAASAAALYQAIVNEGSADQKLAYAERGLLSPTGVSDKVGVAMVSPLRKLQPAPEMGALAARLAILFYTVGDIEAAQPWAELAASGGGGAMLWPYQVLLKQADATGIGEWEQAAALDAPHLARVLTVLSAFNIARPPFGASRVTGDNWPEAPFGDLLAMDKSARDLHVGETVLRALIVLGPEGPARANHLNLRRALADLDQVSLHAEAHALAFEAITAAIYDGHSSAGATVNGSSTGGPGGTGP